jgi:hypothetical protein
LENLYGNGILLGRLNDLDIDFKEEGSILNEHLNSIVFLFLSMIFI